MPTIQTLNRKGVGDFSHHRRYAALTRNVGYWLQIEFGVGLGLGVAGYIPRFT